VPLIPVLPVRYGVVASRDDGRWRASRLLLKSALASNKLWAQPQQRAPWAAVPARPRPPRPT